MGIPGTVLVILPGTCVGAKQPEVFPVLRVKAPLARRLLTSGTHGSKHSGARALSGGAYMGARLTAAASAVTHPKENPC